MYGIVIMMALASSSEAPSCPPPGGGCWVWTGCGWGYVSGGITGMAQPAIGPSSGTDGQQQPSGTDGKQQPAKAVVPKKWPPAVTQKVKTTLADKQLAPADVARFVDDAQAFGCKGADFTDFLNVPGVKAQKGNELKEALDIYLGTLKSIAADPSPKKWPANVTEKVKATLQDKQLSPDDADRFIDDAQLFGCKGADFTDFLRVPGVKAQKGAALKTALEIYMKTLQNIRQSQNSPGEPARIHVSLPADAELLVDDEPTTSTSGERFFTTPVLEIGQVFYYDLKARFIRDGKTVTATQRVTVRAGRTTRVTLQEPTQPAVASK